MFRKTGGFSRIEKLRGKANFALFAFARQYRGKLLRIATVTPDTLQHIQNRKCTGDVLERKVAFSVGKKIFPSAVDRNKIKRQLRDLYRKHRDLLPENIWLMIIVLSGAKNTKYTELETEIVTLFKNITSKSNGSIPD